MGIADIKSQRQLLYDGLENMKEVQMNTSSLSFKSQHPWFCTQWQIRVSCSWLMEWTLLLY
jgi:hypothetical protein